MNLNAIVAPLVSAMTPRELITILPSAGYTTNLDGTRTPKYSAPVQLYASIQAQMYNDMMQVDGLNIQGQICVAYIQGNWDGVVRADGKGGDIVIRPDGTRWLVTIVNEDWLRKDGWVKVTLERQLNA